MAVRNAIFPSSFARNGLFKDNRVPFLLHLPKKLSTFINNFLFLCVQKNTNVLKMEMIEKLKKGSEYQIH